MARLDMSDLEREFIKALLPNKTRGKKPVDDRRGINGIFFVLRISIPWADLREQYGPLATVYNRFNRWSLACHLDWFMDTIADAHNVEMVIVDGISVCAHHSVTTQKKDQRPCLGRSRGGLGTKIPGLTNQDGLRIKYELPLGQSHDADWIRNMIGNRALWTLYLPRLTASCPPNPMLKPGANVIK